MGCVSENELLGFIEGGLLPNRFAAVEEHVEGCAACRELLAEALRDDPETPYATRANPVHGEPPSGAAQMRVGRYALLGPIGAGAMGVVYAARDPELDRSVAIKILRDGGDQRPGPGDHGLLLAEARAMARLSHPNVLAIYEVGEDGPRIFLAMELARESLRDFLARRRDLPLEVRRDLEPVLAVFLGAARGLAAAHAAGLVHRDFKPANVLLGMDGHPRVTDFGLARSIQSSTAPGGSPAYMAPEQMRGERADPRADQFSFCVTLYEALFGELPFAGGSSKELGLAIAARQFRPAPPGSRVPAAVRAVLLRGLRSLPGERFDSMPQLISALERARALPRRRFFTMLAAASAVLALLLFAQVWRQGRELKLAALGGKVGRDFEDSRTPGLESSSTIPGPGQPDELDLQIHRFLAQVGAETYAVPPLFKERLRYHIDQLLRRRNLAVEWERKRKYWSEMTPAFQRLGLPVELAYLAWTESHFDPTARSPTGAFGLWQLMPQTARTYGLSIVGNVDERGDVERSSDAAAHYIASLLAEFGSDSFLLAIASYNMGEVAMRKSLQELAQEPGGYRKDKRDFWHLYQRKLMPEETREYVPRVLAAAIVGSNAARYGLN